MKLEYKILWFEDDEDIVEATVGPQIKRHLESLGFVCHFEHRKNGTDLDQLVQGGNFDLVFTDLNLGEGYETGERLIGHIRDFNILTEVLLYSATTSAIEEIMERTGSVIERISFSAGIENLPEKAKRIISLNVKKIQDVNNMRGLVIAQAIDLENSLGELVLKYFHAPEGSTLEPEKVRMLEEMHGSKMRFHQQRKEEIGGMDPRRIADMMSKELLTANDKYQTVMTIVNEKIKQLNIRKEAKGTNPENLRALESEIDIAKEIKRILIQFHSEVIDVRNTLAHVKEEVGGDGVPFLVSRNKAGTLIRFDDAEYSRIRMNLKKHANNMMSIITSFEISAN